MIVFHYLGIPFESYYIKYECMKEIICVLICCMIGVSAFAQPERSELSHYVFPEFTSGTVLMKTGNQSTALLNYNSLTEEMVFDNKGQKRAIAENELIQIDTVFIRDRKFIVLNGRFVECIYQSGWDLYAEYKCRVREPGKASGYGTTSETSAIESFSSYHAGGMVYDLKLPGYEVAPYFNYLLNRKGEISRFANMNQLKKLYKDRKGLFKEYMKDHEVDYDNKQSVIQLIDYLESAP
jgi:hypothetical protein